MLTSLIAIVLALLFVNTAIGIAAWSRADDAYYQALLGNLMLDDLIADLDGYVSVLSGTETYTTLEALQEEGLVVETDDTGELELKDGLTIEQIDTPRPMILGTNPRVTYYRVDENGNIEEVTPQD